MTDPKELLIAALAEEFPNIPILLQGSMLADESYPDSFFTFWQNSSYSTAFYDEEETRIIWDFDLNAYSTSAITARNMLRTAKSILKDEGWIVDGGGRDVLSDEPTHTGRGINVIYITNETETETEEEE